MARRAFFSFHHQRDSWRAAQVRNSWVTQEREAAGFWDAAAWEEVQKKDEATIKRWIGGQMEGTSVTVVLIGAETAKRKYVKYEIEKSHSLTKGMIGIYINKIKNREGYTDTKGNNPFLGFFAPQGGQTISFASLYPTYDWLSDNGRENIGKWIEGAAKKAGR